MRNILGSNSDMIPFPDKKYNIIYADPPWSYTDRALAGKRGAGCKYDLMSDNEIYSMPIQSISHQDCILFLWVTFPKLQEGLNVISHWGFKYKTCGFTWVKTNKKSTDTIFMGMGNWTRSNAELCLIGIKGKIKRQSASIRSVVMSPIEMHSKKPDIVRENIVRLVGDLPRIELFARQTAKGWDSWGNQI